MNKRNPCTYRVEKFNEEGYLIEEWIRGYAQERKSIDGVKYVYIMNGGDLQFGKWYPINEVKMTKGKWTNDTGVKVSPKSFWKRKK